MEVFEAQREVHVFSTMVPVPTVGTLPINAFLVTGRQPYLVDTGTLADADAFVAAVQARVDPRDLRYIFLSHTDADHVGALMPLMELAPQARLVSTFVGFAKLQLALRPVPPPRILIRNPGEKLELEDRTLTVMPPPVFDAPETNMLYDSRLDALFSADAFGGPVPESAHLANDVPEAQLADAQVLWATADSPWLHCIDRTTFTGQLRELQQLDPAWVFSAHLPPARRMAAALCQNLLRAPDAAPIRWPDQAAFEAITGGAGAPAHA
ncbi:MAG: MBL fold metallo-hydrolase [Myxococcales bacterium]